MKLCARTHSLRCPTGIDGEFPSSYRETSCYRDTCFGYRSLATALFSSLGTYIIQKWPDYTAYHPLVQLAAVENLTLVQSYCK